MVDIRELTVPNTISSGALRRTARIFAFVIFAALGAQLAVRLPFTPVPVTLQTLFVVMAGITLGPRDGFYTMLTYLALGAAGVPVFAGFGFGPVHFLGPTGGYLIAFPAAALIAGWIYNTLGENRMAVISGALCGSALILVSGSLYLALILQLTLAQAVTIGIVPFALGEVIKSVVAVSITGRR